MTTTHAAQVRHEGLTFGEAPRWHEDRLWFSDFYRHRVYSLGDDGEREEHVVDHQPSGLGWQPDGTLLVVSMTDHRVIAFAPDGTSRVHADLSAHCGHWANDMCVAADGTAYVGNFGFDLDAWLQGGGSEPLVLANLVVVAPDGSVAQVVGDLAFPNGTVLTDDGSTLIVAETMANRLTAFDVDASGHLSNRRTFAELDGRVFPDGICLDAEGQVWVATASTAACLRVREGGEVTATMTTSQTTYACMLGGEDRRTLFAMTAPSSDTRVVGSARLGRIEAGVVDVPGAGRP
jgi:sugar lactone lactonase YvrE